jgi:vancomycin permeability regulator SanA
MTRYLFRFLWLLTAAVALGILFIIVNYFMITVSVQHLITEPSENLPQATMVLVPGSGNSDPGLWENPTFDNRMIAAYRIAMQDTAAVFYVSGLVQPPYYDEPADMEKRLASLGVPHHKIIKDTTGYRTWNSVMNAGRQSAGKKFIIVSQQEHLERALFCAGCQGWDAAGVVAESPSHMHRFWTYREYLSRVKATLDCVEYKLNLK